VFNLNGQKVMEISNPALSVDITSLKNGIYIVHCIDKKGRGYSQKLIKNP
jgi:hypothetical protein